MDYSYFINDAGEYIAKRLPAPKASTIKIKDITELADFRFDLKDFKPSSEDQFIELYNHFFDSIFSYEIEVETFAEIVIANRNKFLGTNVWLKRHWDDIECLYDPDENEDEYEWQVVDESFSNALLKAKLAIKKTELEREDWSNYFHLKRVAELKAIAKPLGIKVSQAKGGLVKDLLSYQHENPDFTPLPTIIKILPQLKIFIQELQKKYINELEGILLQSGYPRVFQALIWKEVANFDTYCFVQMLAKDKLVNFSDINGVVDIEFTNEDNNIFIAEFHENSSPSVDEIMEQKTTNGTVSKLDQSIRIIFDYIDSNGQSTSREFRLDKIVRTDDETYLHGFCYLRNSARHFRLDRIQDNIVIKDTGEIIPKSSILDLVTIEPKAPQSSPVTPSLKPSIQQSNYTVEPLGRKVSAALAIGIICIPILFAWLTLRKGHSSTARVMSFGWLILTLVIAFSGKS